MPAVPTALLVVDVQRGFDDLDHWGPRDNPDCEANVARLLAHWRAAEAGPVVFVRHDSIGSASPLRPGQPGNGFKDCVTGEPDLLVTKDVNSAFLGAPDLDGWLRERGIGRVAVCGISTNHCCETTARMAGNLGYEVDFVLDATHSFDRAALDGTTIPAATLRATTAANLNDEFARIVATADLVG